MRIISKSGLMIALAGSLFMSSCEGTYYIAARPVEPVYVRPVAPYRGAIWIDGDWVWRGGNYVFIRGHWDRPRPGRVWVRGAWVHGPRGWVWHRGQWGN